VACLAFTRLPYFQTLGIPAAIGVLVTLAAALTLGPAVLMISSRFGLSEPKRNVRASGWRRTGTAIVRWPGPILVVSCAIALLGLLALPGYKTRRPRPASRMLRPYGSRTAVRELLHSDAGERLTPPASGAEAAT
jgi:uncharacterized membrane protein YdfJ with MMPL/SSD domain